MCWKDFINIQLIRRNDNSFYRTVMYYKICTPVQKNYTGTQIQQITKLLNQSSAAWDKCL